MKSAIFSMSATIFRSNFHALLLAALGAAACASDAPADALNKAPAVYTVLVAQGKPALIADEALTIELTAVDDSRCPIDARCIWAGHAAVTLKLSKAGSPGATVTIGTPAPADMKLPFDAGYGAYTLHLEQLEPAHSIAKPATLAMYRATVAVSRK